MLGITTLDVSISKWDKEKILPWKLWASLNSMSEESFSENFHFWSGLALWQPFWLVCTSFITWLLAIMEFFLMVTAKDTGGNISSPSWSFCLVESFSGAEKLNHSLSINKLVSLANRKRMLSVKNSKLIGLSTKYKTSWSTKEATKVLTSWPCPLKSSLSLLKFHPRCF